MASKMNEKLNAPKWLQAFFNSFSQVVFVENIISGALILAAFAVFSAEINNWLFTILPILGVIVSNVTAKLWGCSDDDTIAAGLCGFNSVLVCCAAALFFTGVPAWIVALLGSFLVVPVQSIINKVCSRFGLPGFTMPFIAIAWFFILLSFQSGLVHIPGKEASLVATNTLAGNSWSSLWGAFDWPKALTWGISEIWPGVDTIWGGLIILLAFAIDRWHIALKVAGVVIASLALGLLFKVNMDTLNAGLYTYSAILAFLGLELFSTSKKTHPVRYWFLQALALLFCFLSNLALQTVLAPVGLPCLTFPFVIVGWGVLYFEQQLKE